MLPDLYLIRPYTKSTSVEPLIDSRITLFVLYGFITRLLLIMSLGRASSVIFFSLFPAPTVPVITSPILRPETDFVTEVLLFAVMVTSFGSYITEVLSPFFSTVRFTSSSPST